MPVNWFVKHQGNKARSSLLSTHTDAKTGPKRLTARLPASKPTLGLKDSEEECAASNMMHRAVPGCSVTPFVITCVHTGKLSHLLGPENRTKPKPVTTKPHHPQVGTEVFVFC